MRISVVTISYNQAPFLESCIRSVTSQSGPEIEYILVDPGSNDGSREIASEHSSKISKLIFEPDSGPSDGLNKGFAHSTGEILCYINADDLLLPGSLTRVAREFSRRPHMDVLLGHGFKIDAEGQVVRRIFSSTKWSPYLYAAGVASAVQQATFFRRSIFEATEGFNAENYTCWDGELLVDMALAGATLKTTEAFLGAFRVHPASLSGSGRLQQSYELDQERITRKILGRDADWRERCRRGLHRATLPLFHPRRFLAKLRDRLKSCGPLSLKLPTT